MEDAVADLVIRARAAYRQVVADPVGFSPVVDQLVVEARTAKSVEALCYALRASAWSARYQLAHAKAMRLLAEGVRLARREGLDEALGELLISRGAVHHELGHLRPAERDFRTAETLLQGRALAELRVQQGTLHLNAGRLSVAARHYQSALSEPSMGSEMRFHALNNLGLTLAMLGRFDEALSTLDEAVSLGSTTGATLHAIASSTRAWATVQSGRVALGIARFDDAKGLRRRGRPPCW